MYTLRGYTSKKGPLNPLWTLCLLRSVFLYISVLAPSRKGVQYNNIKSVQASRIVSKNCFMFFLCVLMQVHTVFKERRYVYGKYFCIRMCVLQG
jgi:hypothetical protein